MNKPLSDLISKKIENIIKSETDHATKAAKLLNLYEELNSDANIVYSFYESQMEKAEKEVDKYV